MNSSKTASRKSVSANKKSTNKTRKNVKFNSPVNQVRVYSLDNEEKKMKMASPNKKGIKCTGRTFPCIYRGVEFETEEEWNEYMNMLREKTIGNNSVMLHRYKIMNELSKKGKKAKRIPQQWRLYNIQTGEIMDLRTMKP